jgi:hypothetical protein
VSQQKLIPDEEFERAWDRLFMRDLPLPDIPAAVPQGTYPFKIEDVVRQSIRELRLELGKTWLPYRLFGTRLHAIVRRNIAAITSPTGWTIAAEQPLRTFAHLPANVINMTLEQYLAGPATHLAWLEKDLRRVMHMKMSVGDLRPDLVIQGPDRVTTIWDLTSRERTEHVAKTILYANLLARSNQLTRIGETYWLQRSGF